ncbi:hypothetical protein QOT17_011260 [Balamuthia mandrillaris]
MIVARINRNTLFTCGLAVFVLSQVFFLGSLFTTDEVKERKASGFVQTKFAPVLPNEGRLPAPRATLSETSEPTTKHPPSPPIPTFPSPTETRRPASSSLLPPPSLSHSLNTRESPPLSSSMIRNENDPLSPSNPPPSSPSSSALSSSPSIKTTPARVPPRFSSVSNYQRPTPSTPASFRRPAQPQSQPPSPTRTTAEKDHIVARPLPPPTSARGPASTATQLPPVTSWYEWRGDPLNPNPRGKACTAQHCKVIASGYTRSSSTWQFNVLKLLVQRATGLPEDQVASNHGHEIRRAKQLLDGNPVAVAKIHEYFDPLELAGNAKGNAVFVFTSIRDPRDSAASCHRLMAKGTKLFAGSSSCEKLVQEYFQWYQQWLRFSDYDLSYVASVHNPVQEIQNMAQVLGITDLTREDFETIHRQVLSSYKSKEGKAGPVAKWDPQTGFNTNHITDSEGGIGSFLEVLPKESIQLLDRHFGEWLCVFGFARCKKVEEGEEVIVVEDYVEKTANDVPYFGFRPTVPFGERYERNKRCDGTGCKVVVMDNSLQRSSAAIWQMEALRWLMSKAVTSAPEDIFVAETHDLFAIFQLVQHSHFLVHFIQSAPQQQRAEEEEMESFLPHASSPAPLSHFFFTSQRDPRDVVADCSGACLEEASLVVERHREWVSTLADHDTRVERCLREPVTELREMRDTLGLTEAQVSEMELEALAEYLDGLTLFETE